MHENLSSKANLWADRISSFQENGQSRKEWNPFWKHYCLPGMQMHHPPEEHTGLAAIIKLKFHLAPYSLRYLISRVIPAWKNCTHDNQTPRQKCRGILLLFFDLLILIGEQR